jgi:hypothetical protein
MSVTWSTLGSSKQGAGNGNARTILTGQQVTIQCQVHFFRIELLIAKNSFYFLFRRYYYFLCVIHLMLGRAIETKGVFSTHLKAHSVL